MNGASLAAVRVAVGLVMSLEAYSLSRPNSAAISMGTTPLETYYTGPDIRFHFPYEGFEWLPLLPPWWIHVIVGILALAGVTMALGLWYRTSAAAVFLAWGYLFLVESTRTYWQSHYYLELLLTFLMIWMPAAQKYSLDAWRARPPDPSGHIPFWPIFLLRGQLAIAYFYAGVAKLNADWLLDAVPVRWFLAKPEVTEPFGHWLSATQYGLFKRMVNSVEFAYLISYTGVVFDLAIGLLLLIRRTRIFGLLLMFLFHATNHFLIFDDIGWFPLVGAATALIFLDADWPERFWNWLRRPRVSTPDWGWFAVGAIVCPPLGATLGWKLKPTQDATSGQGRPVRALTAFLVLLWLVWQAFLPLRHFLIPGDARITYEGLSFSWRLKSDTRLALAHQLFVYDPAIISRDPDGRTRIHWNEWRGDKVLFRKITPGQIDWRLLPEVVVVQQPFVGQQIFYNPFAGLSPARTEAESRERITKIWQENYGREPQGVRPATSLSQALDSASTQLIAAGRPEPAAKLAGLASRARQLERNPLDSGAAKANRGEIQRQLDALREELGEKLGAMLQSIGPFAVEGERLGTSPFLLIEDPRLFDNAPGKLARVDPKVWKNGPATIDATRSGHLGAGAVPVVIYTTEIGREARDLLPEASIFDSQDHPEQPAYIRWNSIKDLSLSKFLHVSNQAFYLRRYARRVAALWKQEYGRRPRVTALARVSFNGRPYQLLVNPEVNLADVPVKWFSHNPWINDLETPRIPRDALDAPKSTTGR